MAMTDLPDIILFGQPGAGKSTASKLLEELGYRRLAFAGVAEHPHPGSPRDWVTRAWGQEAVNDREKLVAVAEAARAVDPEVWLHSLERMMDSPHFEIRKPGWHQPIVVDDARYPNEYWGLKGRGFKSIRVIAPSDKRELRLRANSKWLDGYEANPIEHHLDDVVADYTLNNDGTFEEFWDDVTRILERERKRR